MKQELRYTDKKGNRQSAYIPAKNPLPTREQEVLILSEQGLTSKQTAEALEVSLSTVSKYKQRAFEKLECNRIKDAVNIAINMGYIEKYWNC